jgi:hypothetical protein
MPAEQVIDELVRDAEDERPGFTRQPRSIGSAGPSDDRLATKGAIQSGSSTRLAVAPVCMARDVILPLGHGLGRQHVRLRGLFHPILRAPLASDHRGGDQGGGG